MLIQFNTVIVNYAKEKRYYDTEVVMFPKGLTLAQLKTQMTELLEDRYAKYDEKDWHFETDVMPVHTIGLFSAN